MPSLPPPHPTLTLYQSYCKLNIKPIILCIWVLVLPRRTGSAARPQLDWHTLPRCCYASCWVIGWCWGVGVGRLLTTHWGLGETITCHAQKCNVRTRIKLKKKKENQKKTHPHISWCSSILPHYQPHPIKNHNAYINMFHSVYSKDIIYGKRWYAATKAEPPHWKKLLSGKLLAAQMQLTVLGGVAWQKDDLARERGGGGLAQISEVWVSLSELCSVCYLRDWCKWG